MKWSWTIGHVGAIRLRVHATFLILLAWLALIDYRATGDVANVAVGVVFTVTLFASVLLHELGHALAAQRIGVPTRDITLLPIGGVARLEHIPDDPKQELQIALAGPAVTLVIAFVLAIVLRVGGWPMVPADATANYANAGAFIGALMSLNVALLVFNLLPAFPMDGGRVLRALLSLRMGRQRATDIASRIGRTFALLFGLIGLLYNPFLVLIALFIWISAAAESAELHQQSALAGVSVDRVMVTDVQTLTPSDTLNDAVHHVLSGFQQDFPVVDGGRLVGVLSRADLLAGVATAGADSPVRGAMKTAFQTVAPEEPALAAWTQLRESRQRILPVVRDGRLYGLLTSENVAEYMMIDAVLRSPEALPQPSVGHLRPSMRTRL
jgi:Zn-dependent protease/CBS domain-containing protein